MLLVKKILNIFTSTCTCTETCTRTYSICKEHVCDHIRLYENIHEHDLIPVQTVQKHEGKHGHDTDIGEHEHDNRFIHNFKAYILILKNISLSLQNEVLRCLIAVSVENQML
jgi:hypothetical protein